MKSRLAGATKGHGLLKKKADALQMRFRLILGKIIEVGPAAPDVATLNRPLPLADQNANGSSDEGGSLLAG